MIIQARGEDPRGMGNTRQRSLRKSHWQEEISRTKCTAIFMALLSILFIFLNGNAVALAGNVNFDETLEIAAGPEKLLLPRSFCVTEDELFIIPDYQAGDIKIYEESGQGLELVSTLGEKGYGKDEFQKPTFCFYDKGESKFGILDIGIRKIFIYDRMGRIEFKRVKEIACWRGGTDIQLVKDKLLISGYTTDQNETPYDLYYIDLMTNQTTFLLPSYLKYGLKSVKEYETEYRGKTDIPAIGISSWFDIYGDDVYFIWEGDLKVIKLNIVSGNINPRPFGTQSPHYIKPYASNRLVEGYSNRDKNLRRDEKSKMSYVRGIYTTSDYVLVIYSGVLKKNNGSNDSNLILRFYTLGGDFIKEQELIPETPGDYIMSIDKERNVLYLLQSKAAGEQKKFFISTYKIK